MTGIFETPYMKIWKDGEILCSVYKDQLEIDLDIAKHCVEHRIKFSDSKSYPCLIDMKGVRSATKEAREYMAREGSLYMTAGALITGSALTKMLGNIFLSINQPAIPTKLFTSEVAAREWLKHYL